MGTDLSEWPQDCAKSCQTVLPIPCADGHTPGVTALGLLSPSHSLAHFSGRLLDLNKSAKFRYCTVCNVVIEAEKIGLSGSTNTLRRRYGMSTLDEITKEKQRISEALARVDMQHDKLASQLGELEATERVLARYSKGTQLKQAASARTPATATKAAAHARRRGPPPTTTAKAAGGNRSSS